MNSTTAELTVHAEPHAAAAPMIPAGRNPFARLGRWRPAATACGVALGCLVAASGGAWAWLGSLAAVGIAFAATRTPRSSPRSAATHGDQAVDAVVEIGGARLMIDRIVPVWSRQLDATRGLTEGSFNETVQAFSRVSDSLSKLAAQAEVAAPAQAGAGAVDDVLQARPDLIDALLAPMLRCHRQHQAVKQALVDGGDTLRQLDRLAGECAALARHARMVGTNAAIEAKRQSGGEQRGRFDAVAHEIRELAARCGSLSEGLRGELQALDKRLTPLRRRAEIEDPREDEMVIEGRVQARRVLGELLGDLSRSLQASRELRETSAQLRNDMDEIFLGFQSGDRVSQMLDILGRDLARLIQWNATHEKAQAVDADRWLAELEASYTMAEQRNQHHNTATVDAGAGVEFF